MVSTDGATEERVRPAILDAAVDDEKRDEGAEAVVKEEGIAAAADPSGVKKLAEAGTALEKPSRAACMLHSVHWSPTSQRAGLRWLVSFNRKFAERGALAVDHADNVVVAAAILVVGSTRLDSCKNFRIAVICASSAWSRCSKIGG